MIIPIFVPHEGCPNNCAFCDQHTISGSEAAPTIEEARRIIEKHLETMNGFAKQIAFFGGSFTGIDEKRQNEYLALAEEYIKKGSIESIRLSTRPDYIDESTAARLVSFGVKNIELGAQSMDSDVLKAVNRGHSPGDVVRAAGIIKKSGAVLGLQMMTGLPLDSEEKAIETAKRFIELGAEETRLYPTIVIRGTALDDMRKKGTYRAQTVEEAVSLCARLYELFSENNVKVLRIGLPDSEKLRQSMTQGPYHPAFGELVISRVYRTRIEKALCGAKCAQIRANPRLISKISGNRRSNIDYFKSKGVALSVAADSAEQLFSVHISSISPS